MLFLDIVIGVNVVHATKNLTETITHVCQITKPHGMLLLVELSGYSKLTDLIFGLLPGWWRFDGIFKYNYFIRFFYIFILLLFYLFLHASRCNRFMSAAHGFCFFLPPLHPLCSPCFHLFLTHPPTALNKNKTLCLFPMLYK